MRRRAFIALVGSAATWPLAVRAQQPAMALVGLLSSARLDDRQIDAIRRGLKHAGYIEGRNIAIKYRSADSRFDRLPALAADLTADPVSAIIALAPPAAVAAKAATTAIPIVFAIGADPVDLGLVSNFSHPGGNITGVTFVSNTLSAKRLELVRELVPGATVIGLLVNPGNPTSEPQTDAAFESAVRQRVNAVIIGADSLFVSRRDQLVGLTARFAIPAIHIVREFADIGGLASYGPSQTDAYSLAGTYAGRILKGEKPGDLPIQRAAKFELVINLKPAKALGLTVPTHLQQIADVIE